MLLPRIRHCCRTLASRHYGSSQWMSTSTSAPQSDEKGGGPNQAILEMLQKNMRDEVTNPERNPYKVRAFSTAINVIRHLDRPITTIDDVTNLKGVGPGIARRIREYLDAHAPRTSQPILPQKLDETSLPTTEKLKEELMSINGIGPIKAQALINAGCKSLDDLKLPNFRSKLSNAQIVGIDYLLHLKDPVQRHEAETALRFIQESISSKFEVHLVGSYRRGASTSSDVDIMLLHPSHVHVPTPSPPTPSSNKSKQRTDASLTTAFRTVSNKSSRISSLLSTEVIPSLQDRGLIAATLSSGAQKWQGIVLIPENANGQRNDRQKRLKMIEQKEGTYRRLDISLVPIKSRGAALLSLTGDVEFNRHLRNKALKLGLHLNEYGLWRWQSNGAKSFSDEDDGNSDPQVGDQGTNSHPTQGHWELIKAETERDIMLELGMEYVDPERRNYAFVVDKPIKKKRGRKPLATSSINF